MIASGSGTEEGNMLSATAERFCRRFSLVEVQLATEDFSEEHLVGNGGFGKVYKGQIDNGHQIVAIKRLAPNSNQGEGEFLMEIETLSQLRHINLVSLIGYCNENGEMILVYEYIARGTLADHLYRLSRSRECDDCSSLTWKQRLNICIGAGRGIDYLHTGTSIIHRDVKSTNILLDENFTAKVSDFGLAKHLSASNSKSHVSTIVKGSFGYLDPSYFSTCRLTRKSDTYAFGVVLLEVLCGRPAVDLRRGEDETSLIMWALEKISKGKVDSIVASYLREKISADCLKVYLGIAKRCLNREPKKRPTMAQVVVQLEFALEQQDRKAPSRFLPFWHRGRRATGSTEKEHKQGDVNTQSTAIPAAQEEGLMVEQNIYMFRDVGVPAIPIRELKDMTDNFSSKCLIGERSNGNVYRGTLKSGQVTAIKKLKYSSLSNEEFLAQVSMVSCLKHENVARLLGYYQDGFQRLMVCEFTKKGSLRDVLHGQRDVNGSKPFLVLSWAQRVKIAVGAAKGLKYIGKKAQIHFNIRSNNILVCDDEVAKLADFGHQSHYTYSDFDPFDFGQDHAYRAPELFKNGYLSGRRSDVYSFGVVLLELLTGTELVDLTRPRGQLHIVQWARPWLSKDKVEVVMDPRLNGDYPPKAVAKMAEIAALCLHHRVKCRPDMSAVVRALRPLLDDCSAA